MPLRAGRAGSIIDGRACRFPGGGSIDNAVFSTLAIALLCGALSFLPGYGVLVHLARLRPAERLACSGLLSAAFCGLAALGCFLAGSSTWPAVVLPLVAGGGGLILAAWRGRAPELDGAARQIALFWLLLLGELLAIEALLPTFGGAGWYADWWVHLHRALVYANEVPVQAVAQNCAVPHPSCPAPVYDNGVMTARTPLYNLLCGIALGLDGGNLRAFQIAAAAWGALLAGPVVLLAQRRGLQAGLLAGGLLLLNPFLVHLAAYPWPKVLTGAFEVLAIYWLCRVRDGAAWAGAAASASLALAVFTHTGALIYVFAAALYLAFVRRPSGAALRAMAAGLLATGVLILPWLGWGIHTYGWHGVFLSSPTTSITPPPPSVWVAHKIDGLIFSFVPVPLLSALAHGPFVSSAQAWYTANVALEFPFDTYTGAQGAVACLLLLRWHARARLGREVRLLGGITVTCAALGAVLLDPAYLEGGAAVNAMAGAVALGLVFLAALEPLQHRWRAVLMAVGAEMALVFALYLAYLGAGPWRLDGNVPRLAAMQQHMLSESLGTAGIVAFILALLLGLLLALWVLYWTPGRALPAAARDAALTG